MMEVAAPDGDLLGYLGVANMVQSAGESDGLTRYTFTIDGMRYGAYLRDIQQRQMLERGELPVGAQLDVPKTYAQMSGEGELWLNALGLPTRLRVKLHFPPDKSAQVNADIDTSFFDYANTPQFSATPSTVDQVQRHITNVVTALHDLSNQYAVALLIAGSGMIGVWLLVVFYQKQRYARQVYRGFAVGMVAVLVASPILQGTQSAFAKSNLDAREAKSATRERETKAYNDALTKAQAVMRSGIVNLAPEYAAPSSALSLIGTNAVAQLAPQGAPSNTDTDNDGLTDFEEGLIGTDPTDADTDGDGISDKAEVDGITVSSKHFQLNPLNVDSNGDGRSDGIECQFTTVLSCPNTDGDGIPDAFTDDNDGDGVADKIDLSPNTVLRGGGQGSSFGPANPLQLTLNSTTVEKPLFVEFNLRPTDPRHLRFAYNVLDWYGNDRKGQVQDIDSKTFADLGGTNPHDGNGDIKLLPYLEIRISDGDTTLLSAADLGRYGIALRDAATGNPNDRIALVPLQLINDDKTGEYVAFYAKMLYRGSATWQPQSVRMVWAVQMLNDLAVPGQPTNVPQIIHQYDDNWILTGLNVREDHGADVAIVYESPLVDPERDMDDNLMLFADGLGSSFLAGRDCDTVDASNHCVGNGQLDITVAEIARRFNYTNNSGVSLEQRWGLSNTLRVQTYSYATVDEMQAVLAMTDTHAVLDGIFSPAINTLGQVITPTLLFAREEHWRALNLDALNSQSGTLVVNGNTARLTLADANGALPVQTVAGVNWRPYRYNYALSTTGEHWVPMQADEYFGELAHRYKDAFDDELRTQVSSTEQVEGQRFMVRMSYLALMSGISSAVQRGNEIAADATNAYADKVILFSVNSVNIKASTVTSLASVGTRVVTKFIIGKIYKDGVGKGLVDSIGKKLLGRAPSALTSILYKNSALKPTGLWQVFKANKGKFIGAALMFGAVALAAGLLTKVLTNDNAAAVGAVMGVTVIAIFIAAQVIKPAITIYQYYKAAKELYGAARAMELVNQCGMEVRGTSLRAEAIGLIIQLAFIWGFFIFETAMAGLAPGSLGFNALAAKAIADTIFAIFTFIIGLAAAGGFVLLGLGLMDTLLTALCHFGVKDACFTISGLAQQIIAGQIYGAEVTLDTTNADFIKVKNINTRLGDPNRGYVNGNSLIVELDIETNPHQGVALGGTKVGIAHQILSELPNAFSENTLRDTAINYTLNTTPTRPTRGSQSASWGSVNVIGGIDADALLFGQVVARHHADFRAASRTERVATTNPLTAGRDRKIGARLNLGMTLPAFECWSLGPINVSCKHQVAESVSNGDDMGIVLDVFPASLDAFASMAWMPEVGQRDADGDGLISMAFGGNDPDDTNPDSDGDGLSDDTEMRLRESGVNIRLASADSDGDGLTDSQEVELGTDPSKADTDGDGLTDNQEVDGWTLIYNPWTSASMHVDANPLKRDSDDDTISDKSEHDLQIYFCQSSAPLDTEAKRQSCVDFAWNPRATNVNYLALTPDSGDDDGFLARGQQFTYTLQVENRSTDSTPLGMNGAVTITRPAAIDGNNGVYPFNLFRQQSMQITESMQVRNDIGTQPADIVNLALARLSGASIVTTAAIYLDNETRVPLTVDADAPTAAIGSFSNGTYFNAGTTQIVGGSASDPTSYINLVEMRQCNTCANVPATGKEAWSYALTVPITETRHDLFVRATDAVGNTSSDSGKFYYADGTPPTVTVPLSNNAIVRARQDSDGRFTVALNGTVSDPRLSTLPSVAGSGSQYVEVRLTQGIDQLGRALTQTLSADWQRVEVAPLATTWAMTYVLPTIDSEQALMQDPCGVFTLEVRTADQVNNISEPGQSGKYLIQRLRIDNKAPLATLIAPAPDSGIPLTSTGVVTYVPESTAITQVMQMNGSAFDIGDPLDVRVGVYTQSLKFTPADLGVAPGMWRAWYRNTTTAAGTPSYETISPDIDYTWADAPITNTNADGFSVDWQKDALFRVSGVYSFTVERESGGDTAGSIRAFLDGAQIANALGNSDSATVIVPVTVGLHTIRVIYADGSGLARAKFDVRLKDAFEIAASSITGYAILSAPMTTVMRMGCALGTGLIWGHWRSVRRASSP